MRFPYILLGGLFLCLLYSACSTSKESTVKNDTGPDRTDEAYYKKLGSNIERLRALREGLFVFYTKNDEEAPAVLWRSSGDSILLYSRAIGDVNRNGVWLVHSQFISSLPKEPILTFVEYFERISRDTFVGKSYVWKDGPSASELIQEDFKLPDDFDYEALKEGAFYEKLTYVRQDAAHFKGFSPETEIYSIELKERYAAQKDYYDLRPEVAELRRFYMLENGEIPDITINKRVNEIRRLPKEVEQQFRESLKAKE